MDEKHLEIIAAGRLVDFLLLVGLVPLADGYVESRRYGPHLICEIAATYKGPMRSEELLNRLAAYLDKLNAVSAVKFTAYDVKIYTAAIYVSISQ